jgi:hypothetical protein
MKALPSVLCALLLNACSGSFYLSSGGPGGAAVSSPAGSSITTGPAGLHANINTSPGPWFGAVILGVAIAEGVDRARSPERRAAGVLPMDERRRISVQDCTLPIDISLGNISCR